MLYAVCTAAILKTIYIDPVFRYQCKLGCFYLSRTDHSTGRRIQYQNGKEKKTTSIFSVYFCSYFIYSFGLRDFFLYLTVIEYKNHVLTLKHKHN